MTPFRPPPLRRAGEPSRYAPTEGDLLACANQNAGQHAIYTIKFNHLIDSPPGPVDGTATLLFTVSSNGAPVCDGLAWDQSTDTIYKTEKNATNVITFIKRYDKNGRLSRERRCLFRPAVQTAAGSPSREAVCC